MAKPPGWPDPAEMDPPAPPPAPVNFTAQVKEEDKTGDRRDTVLEFQLKVEALTRYYMAEHDLSNVEVCGAIDMVKAGYQWVYWDASGLVLDRYRQTDEGEST